jgi:hypothetical protein
MHGGCAALLAVCVNNSVVSERQGGLCPATASFAHLLCPFLTEEANDEWREATT